MTAATRDWLAAGERRSALAGVTLLAAGAAGFLMAGSEQFFRSYLHAFAFWLGIPFGCLLLLMIHGLTGGRWGMAIRHVLVASATTLPLCLVMFLPLLLGMNELFPWTHPEVAAEPVIQHKLVYLNVPFFMGRAAAGFAVWIACAFLLRRRLLARGFDQAPGRAIRVVSGPGIVLCALTMTFTATDWLMSIEPHWFSTMFPVIVMVGNMLSAMSFVVAAFVWMRKNSGEELDPDVVHDLGNLILVFTMLWAYCAYSQYLIIYAGNVSEDVGWYVHRSQGSWRWVAIALMALHFAVPFLVLLSRKVKRNASLLVKVALGMLVMRLVDLYWLCAPSFYEESFHLHWLDVVLPAGLGGIWIAYFLRQYQHAPAARPKARTAQEKA